MGDSGLLAAIAQWVSTIGVPAMVVAWFRLWQQVHALDVQIVTLRAKMIENDSVRHDVNEMKATMTEVRIIVGELKVKLDYQSRERRVTDRNDDR